MSRENREQLIDSMSAVILRDRAATHGSPEDSFGPISDYWTVYLSRRHGQVVNVSRSDVAIMMALLKVARVSNNPSHLDNYVDGAGYMILAGEPHV